jgi:hypothetical protein
MRRRMAGGLEIQTARGHLMGELAADIAAASSVASIDFRAFGDVTKVERISAADHFKAAELGTEQKNIEVDSILQQAQQNEADAAYPRTLGKLTMNGMRRPAKLGPHQPLGNRQPIFGMRSWNKSGPSVIYHAECHNEFGGKDNV